VADHRPCSAEGRIEVPVPRVTGERHTALAHTDDHDPPVWLENDIETGALVERCDNPAAAPEGRIEGSVRAIAG
jgi:hypothetical protein